MPHVSSSRCVGRGRQLGVVRVGGETCHVYLKSVSACDRALEGPQLYPNPNTALRPAADMVVVRLDRALVASRGSLMLSNGW